MVIFNASASRARLGWLASLVLHAAVAGIAACTSNPVVAIGDGGADSLTPDSASGADASGCIDVQLSPADLTCATDQECTPVITGWVCPGYVPTVGSKLGTLCENAAANGSGAARIGARIAAIPHGDDAGMNFCDTAAGMPRCLQGRCTLCGPFGQGPAACLDAGNTTADGS